LAAKQEATAMGMAPSGPFALNLGEYVSISGTNGYPYEIVLIRHIQPALRCFLSLIPAASEIALHLLNGESILPERAFIAHVPVDSVTHKWILNGVRPKDFTRELALFYINKDVESDRAQKEERKLRKGQALESAKSSSALSSASIIPYSSSSLLTTTSEESCVQSGEFADCVSSTPAVPTAVVIDALLQQKRVA